MIVKEKQTAKPVFCDLARDAIQVQADAITGLLPRIDERFNQACEILLSCTGRIVVLGMGKSGHIASKIAATLASTGSPAFFVHPGEASHGDLGMITSSDVVIALSGSGETQEILLLIPLIKHLGVPLITITGNSSSSLANMATVNLDASVAKEACPLGLAPTSSTTAALVMGDALAIALLAAKGFTATDFARSHPGGTLGRRLLLRIDELMATGPTIPKVNQTASLTTALLEMTEKGLGMTIVVDDNNTLMGIFTDGDLRRMLDKHVNIHTTKMIDVVNKQAKTIPTQTLAIDALRMMEQYKITNLLVLDAQQQLAGVIHLHKLLQAGLT